MISFIFRGLQEVEQVFRDLKELIDIRPVYHWIDRRVKTHIFLCLIAQVVLGKVRRKLKEGGWLGKRSVVYNKILRLTTCRFPSPFREVRLNESNFFYTQMLWTCTNTGELFKNVIKVIGKRGRNFYFIENGIVIWSFFYKIFQGSHNRNKFFSIYF